MIFFFGFKYQIFKIPAIKLLIISILGSISNQTTKNMPTGNKSETTSDPNIFNENNSNSNKLIYLAIAFIIIFTVVAMTGVYYEYW